MKITYAIAGLVLCLTLGLVMTLQRDASGEQARAATVTPSPSLPSGPMSVFTPEPDTYAKKCSFNSDCPYGTCKNSTCGGCSFNSDCKGWGKCSDGWCGGCSFNSECQGFGSCKSGHCEKSPY